MRVVSASEDDLKVLGAKRFIVPFENGVIVIKHWRINNFIRKDRYKETLYLEEKSQLHIKETGAYTIDKLQGIPISESTWKSDEQSRSTTGQPLVNAGKDRLGKVNTSVPLKENMSFKEYNENESPMDVPIVDADNGETTVPEIRGAKKEIWKELIKWAEQERGFAFLPENLTKQWKAFTIASRAKFTVGDLKKRWEEMADDKYWQEKGFDWMTVVYSFNRKGK